LKFTSNLTESLTPSKFESIISSGIFSPLNCIPNLSGLAISEIENCITSLLSNSVELDSITSLIKFDEVHPKKLIKKSIAKNTLIYFKFEFFERGRNPLPPQIVYKPNK
jgi:hypothetical protein